MRIDLRIIKLKEKPYGRFHLYLNHKKIYEHPLSLLDFNNRLIINYADEIRCLLYQIGKQIKKEIDKHGGLSEHLNTISFNRNIGAIK